MPNRKARKVKIDESLNAHIHSDAFLVGSYGLEGNQFCNTIGYLNEYISQLPENTLSEDVKKLVIACNRLVEYEKDIRGARIQPTDLPIVAQKIHDDIKRLRTGDDQFLLIPGGWLAPEGGHAIIYQFSLDKEGNLLFSINNSGSGLNFHEKKTSVEKDLYNPVLTYKIPKKRIGDKNFGSFIAEILKAQIPELHKRDSIKPSYLYEEIFPKLSYVDGVVVLSNSKNLEHWYTGGQLSGTCTQRSLHQMLKSRFSSLDEYRQFIYGFKTYALEDYLTQHPEAFEDSKQSRSLEQAIKHDFRLLNLEHSKNHGVSLFTQEEKKNGSEKLMSWRAKIKFLKPVPIKTTSSAYEIEPKKVEIDLIKTNDVKIEKIVDRVPENTHWPLVLQNNQNILKHIDEVLERCTALGEEQDHALLEQLENFFLSLPLPKDNANEPLSKTYSAIDSDATAFVFFNKMNTLQSLYFDACKRLQGQQVVLPKTYLVKMSIVSVIGHINENRVRAADKTCYHQFMRNMLYKLSPGSPDQVYIANNNPIYDARYEHIRKLYQSADENLGPKHALVVGYYQSLLDEASKNTGIKENLEEKYKKKYRDVANTELHLALQAKGCTSLYYYTDNFEELRDDPLFKPLFNKFKLQLEIEKAYTYGCGVCGSYQIDYTEDEPIKVNFDSYSDSLLVENSPAASNFIHFDISDKLRQSKYNLNDNSAAYSLERDVDHLPYFVSSKRASNHTQLLPGIYANNPCGLMTSEESLLMQRYVNSTDLEERELFHLRTDAASQIRITLDYFTLHLEKCAQENLQRYIEANLFQPGLLYKELSSEKHLSFVKQFDTFIVKGLEFYQKKNQLSQSSLFFIRLAYQVNHYTALYDPDRFGKRLESLYEQINQWLEIAEDGQIKASLHQNRFLTAVAQAKINPESTTHLDEALISYFQLQITKNQEEHLDADQQFHLQCATHDMMRWLSNHQKSITNKQILVILESLHITNSLAHISGKYPLYNVRTKDNTVYILNLERGRIFKDNMAYSTTPLHIQNHPVMKQLGLKELHSCFMSRDEKIILIDKPPISIRFIKAGGEGKYHIQKKWQDNQGNLSWFQLAAMSDAQKNMLHLSDSLSPSVAETVKERDSLAWVHCNNDELLITDAKQQPLYRGTGERSRVELYNIQNQGFLCETDSWIHQRLSALEAPEFITVEQKDKEYIATLGRYGLKYIFNEDSRSMHMDWEGKQYEIQNTQTSVFGAGVAHLTLSNATHSICVLPIQRFINSDERDSHSIYYHLEQDTQAKIPHEIMEKALGTNKLQLWQYTGTEQYIVLKMNENGVPTPQNAEEALYLCYVYLGDNQPEKAWDVLEKLDKQLGGLAGTYNEIRNLNWIIKALPLALDDKDKKAQISNPPMVACQLKALALLANFSRQDKEIIFPEPMENEATVNGQYERKTIDKVKSFYDGVNTDIYSLYSRMQGMRREMPVKFTLSDNDCKHLLEFYHDNLPENAGKPKAVGALGYELVKLQLQTLQEEINHIEIKRTTKTATDYDLKRQKEIQNFIENHQGVAKVKSDLVYVNIDLKLPDIVRINDCMLLAETQKIIHQYGCFSKLSTIPDKEQNCAVEALDLTITDDTFIQNFNAYLSIATTKNNPYREKLLEFCKATLIAHRHVPLDKQPRNIPLLSNILYRILSNPKTVLPSNVVNTYGSFAMLFIHAKTLSAPAIDVPQLVNSTSELFIEADKLLEIIPKPSKPIVPEVLTEELHFKSFEQSFSSSLILIEIMQRWRMEEQIYRTGLRDLLNNDEYEQGNNKYQSLGRLKSIANDTFNSHIIEELGHHTKQALAELTSDQEKLGSELLSIAKEGPEDPALKQKWQIDLYADKRASLDMPKLLTLYFHQDMTRYKTETGLSDLAIRKLHTLLTKYVEQGLRLQQHQRVQKQLERIYSAQNTPEQERGKYLLAQALFSENLIDVVKDPALSLFQFSENILLRPQQKEALSRLLKTEGDNYAQVIEKVIMGGGKSKVILPTLAQKKATGSNLVVLAVPRALLRTNFVDLQSTSNALFNQTAYVFEFNRDSDCSAKRFEQIYNDLTDVMVHKNYLVTTGEALLSLRLKYVELLKSKPVINPRDKNADKIISTWKDQVYWADKLVSLFKHRADLIIDEVHEGLEFKNKLNFTMGEPGPIPKFIVQNSIHLYQFFKHVKLKSDKKHKEITLDDVLHNNTLLMEPSQFIEACQQLGSALIHHEKSPLNTFVKKIGGPESAAASELLKYLQDKTVIIPECVLTASPQEQDKLAFYMRQINQFLPNTLKRNCNENYGPSKSLRMRPETRALAIPYQGNNTPKQRSRFQDCIETSNYTIQSMLILGVGRDLLRNILETWQTEAQKEQSEKKLKRIDATPTAILFSDLTHGLHIPFSDLDLKNEEQLDSLHKHLKHDQRLIYEILNTHVLKHIQTDPVVLQANAYDYVKFVHSCQGMSGTPDNYTTYDPSLRYDHEAAKGENGLVYSSIKAKNPSIRAIDFQATDHLVSTLLEGYQPQDQVRTIIDICATFKGIDNQQVAKNIAQYIYKNPTRFQIPESLQYVLYFNNNNQVSAFRIGEDIASQTPIVIGSSDPMVIAERLNCGPEACFSYYDQLHTVGVDLRQAEQARGLVLIDHDTPLNRFLQGTMRMRGLIEGEQRIDLIVPKQFENVSLDELKKNMEDNQDRQLKQANFDTARPKMVSLVSDDLLNRVLLVQGKDAAEKKEKLMALFDPYFSEKKADENQPGIFFQNQGGLTQEVDTDHLLNSFKQNLIENWANLLHSAGQPPNKNELAAMIQQLEAIVKATCEPGVCEPK